MKTKSLIAGIILATSSSAIMANQFYIDIGMDKGGLGTPANGPTTTAWKSQMQYDYSSSTLITDTDNNGIDTGDTIHTVGGFLEGDFVFDVDDVSDESNVANNVVTSLLSTATNSNGYLKQAMDSWGLTFQFELMGTLGPKPTPTDFHNLHYNSGEITFYYFSPYIDDHTDDFIELFTLDFLSITQNTNGSFLTTQLASVGAGSVNGVAVGDMFNFDEFGVSSMTELLADEIDTFAFFDFNTDNPNVMPNGVDMDGNDTFIIEGDHDGSVDFIVPEPSSLAILGLGLLGLAGAARRRKN